MAEAAALISVDAAFYAYQYIHMRENRTTLQMEWVNIVLDEVIATCTLAVYNKERDRYIWGRILRKLSEELKKEEDD